MPPGQSAGGGVFFVITIVPVDTKDPPYDFLSRCKFSHLTTRQPIAEFYLLTFTRFPLRKKEHKSYLGKNRTHDFRTSRCAGYLLDHSQDSKSTLNIVRDLCGGILYCLRVCASDGYESTHSSIQVVSTSATSLMSPTFSVYRQHGSDGVNVKWLEPR